jgi:hypothetical protein
MNEIRATANLQITKDGFNITGNSTQTLTMTGSNYSGEVFTATTAWQKIPTGSLGDIRYMYLLNNSTASVDITMHVNSSSFSQLRPYDSILMPPAISRAEYYIKATEQPADIQVVIVES